MYLWPGQDTSKQTIRINTMQQVHQTESYYRLSPDEILNAVDSVGYQSNGYLQALNSYENRVYQVGIEDQPSLVVKFYRPGRWTNEAIMEEHAFTRQLAEYEIPVIPPMIISGQTLHNFHHFRFAVFPCKGGHAVEPDNPDQLRQLGRYIARIHNVGQSDHFKHRPAIEIETFGSAAYQYLIDHRFIPDDLLTAYQSLAEDLITRITQSFQRAGNFQMLRIHGDCHPGNVLQHGNELFILDFDDARTGPAIQDLWMFISGDRNYMTARLTELLEGYTEFRAFDFRELYLLEALRTLRMMHYSAWIARRWDDPAFPRAFPFFNTRKYWQDQILALREQAALMDEPPLQVLQH